LAAGPEASGAAGGWLLAAFNFSVKILFFGKCIQ